MHFRHGYVAGSHLQGIHLQRCSWYCLGVDNCECVRPVAVGADFVVVSLCHSVQLQWWWQVFAAAERMNKMNNSDIPRTAKPLSLLMVAAQL